jgi:hypothetical protein
MKHILTIGSCRTEPEYKKIYNIGGYFCKQKNNENQEKYNFWCRPYGQNVSLVDILYLIKNNLKKETFSETEDVSSYVWNWNDYNIDKTQERQFNPIDFYDGYVIEFCSLKHILYNDHLIAFCSNHLNKKPIKILNDINKPVEYFENLFDEIINLLGDKPIIFVSQIPIKAESRYYISYLNSKFCSKYSNTFFLDCNYIIYDLKDISKCIKELPNYNPVFEKTKDKVDLNLSLDKTPRLTHYTEIYKKKLYEYYINFFDLFKN